MNPYRDDQPSRAPTPAPLGVSVVITTFNRAHVLPRALDSVLAQRLPDGFAYEAIVVDNNSTDETRAIVERYREAHPERLRYVFEPNPGPSHGRNAGVEVARAPIVAFTDDDNIVDGDWVQTAKSLLDSHPHVAAIGGKVLAQWTSAAPAWLNREHWSPLAILDYGDQPFLLSRADPRCLLTANLAIRRDVFQRIGGFSPEYPRCQDHELLIRLWRAGEVALYSPALLVWSHIDPERLTKPYHRWWNSQHGFHMARMRLLEIIDSHGRLLQEPTPAARLYGVPGFIYLDALKEVMRCARAFVCGRRSSAWLHEQRARYLVAYISRLVREHFTIRNSLPEIATFVWFHVARLAARARMSSGRLIFVHLALAVLVGMSAYDIKTGQEHWPFSPYPMFAEVDERPTLTALRLFGVTDEVPPRLIALREDALIAPFDQCRLTTAFSQAYSDPERRELLTELLDDSLRRYESRRLAALHQGPPLHAIRLYSMEWSLDRAARNVDAPEGQRLLAQVDWRRRPLQPPSDAGRLPLN
jgi:glycosyltransferase involved in cell wall biosynthesis